ncbi:hypothetical protein SYNPS1DRAFT_31383, partial [Syncephalis pseudoplumigaleata]
MFEVKFVIKQGGHARLITTSSDELTWEKLKKEIQYALGLKRPPFAVAYYNWDYDSTIVSSDSEVESMISHRNNGDYSAIVIHLDVLMDNPISPKDRGEATAEDNAEDEQVPQPPPSK